MYRDRETRIMNLSFTYRFGRSDIKGNNQKRRAGNGSGAAGAKERNNLKTDDNSDSGGF